MNWLTRLVLGELNGSKNLLLLPPLPTPASTTEPLLLLTCVFSLNRPLPLPHLLIPRAPGVPRSCQMDGYATSTKIGSWFSRYTCKKGIRTGCPDAPSDGFVSHGLGERQISWLFTRYSKLTFLFVWRLIYIVPGALFLSLMVGRYFMLSWWH